MMTARRTRVLLADDHTLVRAGVRKILEGEQGLEVVSEVPGGEAALLELERIGADVLVLDITMPGMDGFEVLRRAKSRHRDLKVLILTMHASPEYMARALKEGADGYLLKDSAVHELKAAIGEVMHGRAYFSPAVQREMSRLLQSKPAPRPLDQLTEREREVLVAVAEGQPTKEIASRLHISSRTVETHRANLMRKLDLRSVALLTQFAIREGLLKPPA